MALQSKDDGSCSYKMPKIKTRVHRNVMCSWTDILNAGEIAEGVRRPGYVVTVFFEMELRAGSRFNAETGVGFMYGDHDAAQLWGVFGKFIKKFVECYGCKSHKTEFMVTESQIAHKCVACGFISEVDIKEKYKEYIRMKYQDDVSRKERKRG